MSSKLETFGLVGRILTIIFIIIIFSPGWTGASDETPKYGGKLVIGMFNMPRHLNSALQSGIFSGIPGAQLYAAPLRFDDQWNPQPYLAEKWEIAENGLSVTLHLVKGATFHDGHPITSEDIAFSIKVVRDNHPFKPMFAVVEKVETPDPLTAIIRLRKPHPSILLAMSSVLLPVLPKHIFGDGRDIKTHPANMAPVGSGPFKFVEFVPKDRIVLERNENFFLKERPYLDKITFKLFRIDDPLSVSGGEVHMLTFYSNPPHHVLFKNDKRI
ncbi:MAG: hypothetical protein GY749_09150 [Desulfobacteraceae bacterium]|nr:hypothetical protein [Desulfobacteraceae bacterium]